MATARFLIGFGERLTAPIAAPRRGNDKALPYDIEQSLRRLGPMAARAVEATHELPSLACPRDEVVVAVTLHPTFLAKSYHPGQLLRDAGLFPVGSRPKLIVPRSDLVDEIDTPVTPDQNRLRATTELFVAVSRGNLRAWSSELNGSNADAVVSKEIIRIEEIHLPSTGDKVRRRDDVEFAGVWEVVLHASAQPEERFVISGFESFAESLGAEVVTDRQLFAGGLCFVPVRFDAERIDELAQYSFLRTARPMPSLRPIAPVGAIRTQTQLLQIELPTAAPVDPDMRVAVFDGGVAESGALDRWVTAFDTDRVGPPVASLVAHGQHVSSALLFGSLVPGVSAPTPYGYVDHYRVLDDRSVDDPLELFDVLHRIEAVLAQNRYEFINLSIGPDLPIEDDEVHAWTAFFDDHLSDGHTFATMAVGNNGDRDHASGNSRIQVPADCVNAVGVGAATSSGVGWDRAGYSARGPGRSPGLMKPDFLAFGGAGREPFFVVDHAGMPEATAGTSFAAPTALRIATGVRALFGSRMTPLALKALLVHACDSHSSTPKEDTGWGRIPTDMSDIVLSADGIARIVYQGELTPAKYLRAPIPIPEIEIPGMVRITATITFATDVDPQDPSNYTRSGVEVTFRPRADHFKDERSVDPVSSTFFAAKNFSTEHELRRDAHKWETTLHASRRMRGSSLRRPAFDLHYNAREEGHSTGRAERIRYAMVVTVEAPHVADIHDQILRAYPTQLLALVPVSEIQLRTS